MCKFSEIVTQYRKQQGLTLRDFGDALGLSHQTIANWENGTVPPYQILLGFLMQFRDWRGDFAIDGLAILKPELYEPVTEIARSVLAGGGEND